MGQAYLFIHFIAAKELGKGIFAFLQPPWDSLQVGKLRRCQVANHSKIHYGLLPCIHKCVQLLLGMIQNYLFTVKKKKKRGNDFVQRGVRKIVRSLGILMPWR